MGQFSLGKIGSQCSREKCLPNIAFYTLRPSLLPHGKHLNWAYWCERAQLGWREYHCVQLHPFVTLPCNSLSIKLLQDSAWALFLRLQTRQDPKARLSLLTDCWEVANHRGIMVRFCFLHSNTIQTEICRLLMPPDPFFQQHLNAGYE